MPSHEPAVHGAARRQVSGQSPPLAACAQDGQNGIEDLAQALRHWPGPRATAQKRSHQIPFGIRQVARVAQTCASVATWVSGVHMGASANRSQPVNHKSLLGFNFHSDRLTWAWMSQVCRVSQSWGNLQSVVPDPGSEPLRDTSHIRLGSNSHSVAALFFLQRHHLPAYDGRGSGGRDPSLRRPFKPSPFSGSSLLDLPGLIRPRKIG